MNSVTRKDVIEAYLKYDARKSGRSIPADLSNWPWSEPNALDSKLIWNKYKSGVIAGYKTWQAVRLSRNDLLNCAVVKHMFDDVSSSPATLPRALSELIHCPEFWQWKPHKSTEWYEWLESGEAYPDEWPLILRPALRSEAPAQWYIEDGSGRAVCLLRRLCKHLNEHVTAMGFLGVEPDCASDFMQGQDFRELLVRARAGV